MKLFGSYTSPFVRHCRVALAQSGMDFEFVEVDYQTSAENSPTSKVPYFIDGDVTLTDSTSITKYIREKSGQGYLVDIQDHETFAMASTLLDTSINLFLLENNGVDASQVAYLKRHQDRVESGLDELNARIQPENGISTDGALRVACYIDWALFRKRINIDGRDNLQKLIEAANQVEAFAETAPPQA